VRLGLKRLSGNNRLGCSASRSANLPGLARSPERVASQTRLYRYFGFDKSFTTGARTWCIQTDTRRGRSRATGTETRTSRNSHCSASRSGTHRGCPGHPSCMWGVASTTVWSEPGCPMIVLATDRNMNSPFDMNGKRVETRSRDRNPLVDPKLATFGIPPLPPERAGTNCHEQYRHGVLRHRVLVVPFTTKARKADLPSNRKERAAMHARG
jgi:hypothetical protein